MPLPRRQWLRLSSSKQRAAFPEEDDEMEDAHSVAASAGDSDDAARVIKARIAENPNSLNFSVMLLSKQ
ncbi:unnamed protein product [Urochloa humidicola]